MALFYFYGELNHSYVDLKYSHNILTINKLKIQLTE